MTSAWTLGLTGGIGSGKSAAAEHFAQLGITCVDADQAARWVVEPGRPALAEIAGHFSPAVLQPDGSLDRAALRAAIFADPAERRWLEALLHPLIRQEILVALAGAESPYAILVSPLQFESGQRALVRRGRVIDAPEWTKPGCGPSSRRSCSAPSGWPRRMTSSATTAISPRSTPRWSACIPFI